MKNMIPVIDLFAGPGGLGEGFSSYSDQVFKIKLSVEKDLYAYNTLELRSFFRQFGSNEVPSEYYKLLSIQDREEQEDYIKKLYRKYYFKSKAAKNEVWRAELGKTKSDLVDNRIKKALNTNKDWVLIGGPPCQAYSLAGRSRVGGINEEDNRVFLYREYLRIIAQHEPSIFVMENVKGLLSAELNNKKIFPMILEDLKNPSRPFPETNASNYKIYSFVHSPSSFDLSGNPVYDKNRDYLIKAEDFGVPQRRHRVILLGIREDIDIIPKTLKKKSKTTIKDVIKDLPPIRSGVSREYIKRGTKYSLKNLTDNYSNWKKKVEEQMDVTNLHFKINKEHFIYGRGSNYIPHNNLNGSDIVLKDWFKDEKIKGVCNHESRSHLVQDLGRYIFAADFMQKNNRSPKLSDYPDELLPKHKNVKSGKFVDRFRVQNPREPATTITSHISKDGHYFIHYDPLQCRTLTVREAARVQTFPDNYFFRGSRTQQYIQVGNAVPPYLAMQLAEIVYDILKKHND